MVSIWVCVTHASPQASRGACRAHLWVVRFQLCAWLREGDPCQVRVALATAPACRWVLEGGGQVSRIDGQRASQGDDRWQWGTGASC